MDSINRTKRIETKQKINDIFVLQICENANANSIVLFFLIPTTL